jgi:hypothetical protein
LPVIFRVEGKELSTANVGSTPWPAHFRREIGG